MELEGGKWAGVQRSEENKWRVYDQTRGARHERDTKPQEDYGRDAGRGANVGEEDRKRCPEKERVT